MFSIFFRFFSFFIPLFPANSSEILIRPAIAKNLCKKNSVTRIGAIVRANSNGKIVT